MEHEQEVLHCLSLPTSLAVDNLNYSAHEKAMCSIVRDHCKQFGGASQCFQARLPASSMASKIPRL